MNDFLVPESEVRFNTKVKNYPDGSQRLTVFNKPVYIKPGYELYEYKDRDRPTEYNTDGESRLDNLHRTKNKVFDIAYMNDWQFFVTGTFRPDDKVDRYNPVECKKALHCFLSNQTKRKGLVYLLLPEYHKDGAIHFHALIKGDKLNLVDSGKRLKDGRVIYNWVDWKYGFTTVLPLVGDISFVSKYITKYITKDVKKIFGQYYLAGGKGLKRDVPFVLCNTDFDGYDCQEYFIEDAHLVVKYPENNNYLEVLKNVK